MNVKEALAFADEVVFAKTGKHLDDMQVGVIEGVLKRQKYGDIAQGLNCTEGYAKDVGYELWQLFSDAFGEDVNKLNLRSALIRKSMISNVTGGVISGNHVARGHVIGSLNICTSQEESPEFLRGKQQAKIEAIARLQAIGLSDEQIAQCLDMTLEEIRQVDLTE
ncbi:MAG: hypothetical protein JGK30_14060 [Microcoleus sp. PH2017_40_RAT_O_B]|uniref:hypothetical protein n=1 Tax=unclassified Microcoleus TaxID=2642155 RepID=UPI001D9C6F86|nr:MULTISPECIES: hypothetical protein [unclassified Microcoleus]MCC3509882.1 hypothetical protein [Microcoleus sp. PH2017_17_BER_D_A]TAE67079.1 MAG: hypothetical protein EAZ86_17910 [Oscillatoriales cyanobacterium]MCC3445905.1 hypothetical protein [Microcoleus sp. PH2017_09_SFU_O_A]MCC3573169.1 hypothetical protein [Microcoleus sp. PH2017_34_RAT_O_A]MCC3610597.1 hypothetical protein [Microcoleus sp. PH2017_40_RAT_O_B]